MDEEANLLAKNPRIHETSSLLDSPVNYINNKDDDNDDDDDDDDDHNNNLLRTDDDKLFCLCDPKLRHFRWFPILFLICMLSFGSYFCYDLPASLATQIQNDMNVNIADYTMLYSLYSWPNVVLSMGGGFLIDRVFGIRWGAFFFGVLVTIGQFVFSLGALVDQYWLMETGRFIFGLGGESLAVAQNAYAVAYFKGKELNMVFGITISMSRIGSTVNMNIMQPIYHAFERSMPSLQPYARLGWVLMVGTALCIGSLAGIALLGWLDKRSARIMGRKKQAGTGEKISLRDIKDFPLSLWLITLICVAYYATVFPFIAIGTQFFEAKYGLSPASANALNSIVYIISTAGSPIFGLLIDKTGRNLYWLLLAIVVTLGCHILLCFTFVQPYVSMVFFGIAYSICACALWPLVALVVPENQIGTAYGVMQSVQNLGLAVVQQISGVIISQKGYIWLEIFLIAWDCVALLLVIWLYFLDSNRSGSLNASVAEKARASLQKEKEQRVRSLSPGTSSPTLSPLHRPRSPHELRNRYFSRLGIQLPTTYRLRPLAGRSVLR